MPVTQSPYPILSGFFCAVERSTKMPPQPLDAERATASNGKTRTTPMGGLVLGPDGKPCRSCNSKSAFSAWAAATKKHTAGSSGSSTSSTSSTTSTTTTSSTPPAFATTSAIDDTDCPPDVDALGRSTWTLLHSIAATYPSAPSPAHQATTSRFLAAFAQLYPCWQCAGDFRAWMAAEGNAPRVSSRGELGAWMCEAHNAVNEKLGKERFDCGRWEERWRTGWRDGRCD